MPDVTANRPTPDSVKWVLRNNDVLAIRDGLRTDLVLQRGPNEYLWRKRDDSSSMLDSVWRSGQDNETPVMLVSVDRTYVIKALSWHDLYIEIRVLSIDPDDTNRAWHVRFEYVRTL